MIDVISRSVSILAILLTLFHLYTGAAGPFPNIIQRGIHVGFALAISFFLSAKKEHRKAVYLVADFGLALASIVICSYVVFNYERITQATFEPLKLDLILGCILTVIILEAARRITGWCLPILALLAIVYAYFGPYFPGIWMHRGISLRFIMEVLFTSTRGFWGMITGISATVIAIFIILGSIMFAAGGGKTFINLATWIAGGAYGGGGKVATIASSMFGMISGSAGANVVTVGTFTIPLMKRLGYEPAFAGGVEASASTGGQIMPPIMGAGAFIMAELLEIPYVTIATAAIIPALLYYLGVYSGIHFVAKKRNYKGLSSEEMPKASEVFNVLGLLPVVIPIGILMYLLIKGYTPYTAGSGAIAASLALFFILERRRKTLKSRIKEMLKAFDNAGQQVITIAVLIVCAQILLAMLSVTGVGVKFSGLIIEMGKTSLLLSLICAMFISLMLGIGLPTSGSYLLCAAVVAPAIIRLGIEPLAAHLFVFFFAITAGISPPVCETAFIGASLAGANWVKTAFVAMKLSFSSYIIPFIFAFSPALLLIGSLDKILWVTFISAIAIVAMSSAIMGYMLRPLAVYERAIYALGGFLMIYPVFTANLIGILLVSVLTLSQLLQKKQRKVYE